MKTNDLFAVLAIVVIVVIMTFALTARSFCDWRPQVSVWTEISVPYWATSVKIPKRITWKGVEYECTLVEREQP